MNHVILQFRELIFSPDNIRNWNKFAKIFVGAIHLVYSPIDKCDDVCVRI